MDKKTKKLGVPKRELTPEDLKAIKQLAISQASQNEICGYLHINRQVLQREFLASTGETLETFLDAHRNKGRGMIRIKQFDSAMSGNVGMLVWLGKQYLEQSDKMDNNQANIVTTQPINFQEAYNQQAAITPKPTDGKAT